MIFAFLAQGKIGHRSTTVRFRGLEADAVYTVLLENGELKKSGAYLMRHGLELRLNGDYASTLIRFAKCETGRA